MHRQTGGGRPWQVGNCGRTGTAGALASKDCKKSRWSLALDGCASSSAAAFSVCRGEAGLPESPQHRRSMSLAVMGPPLPVEDPTVCNPAELAQIQAQFGISLKDTNPEVIRHIVDRSKQAGNDAFKQRNYKGACALARRGPAVAQEAEKTRCLAARTQRRRGAASC